MKKICLLVILLTMFYGNVSAFNDTVTHRELTKLGVDKSSTDKYLRDNLNFPYGVNTKLGEKIGIDWIRDGSQLEDEPACRASNHFHDPGNNLEWTASGLADRYWFVDWWCGDHWWQNCPPPYSPDSIVSNILWATGHRNPLPDAKDIATQERNEWDWSSAREYFYIFLTGKDFSGTETARDENARTEYMGKTLRSLGQVLHLLQDTAVPAHVRNDFISHLDFVGFRAGSAGELWRGNKFEAYVRLHNKKIEKWVKDNYGGNVPPDRSLTDFWDTNNYTGSRPMPDEGLLGLSEYTNLNFVSKYTIFEHYPYPSKDSTDIGTYLAGGLLPETVIAEDGIPDTTFYIKKIRDGEQIGHFVKPGYFTLEIQKTSSQYGYDDRVLKRTLLTDEKCFEDYAEKLIPRAVAYSAGLLDYFFRGRLEISLPETGAYSVISDPDSLDNPSAQGFDTVRVCVKNVSAEGEDMSGGKLTAVVKYRLSRGNPFQNPPALTSDEFYYVTGETGDGLEVPRDSPATFEFFLNRPVPLRATDVYIYLVYRGKLGTEADGVAVGFKDISEPTPLRLFNATDKICLFGDIYDSGSDEARNAVDATENGGNGNGKADESGINPYNISNIVCSFAPAGTPLLTIVPREHLTPFALLTDYEFAFVYGNLGRTVRYGIKNQYEAPSSLNVNSPPVRKTPHFAEFRGVAIYSGSTIIHLITPYPENASCAFPDAYDY
jgi:hypothetical protein